MMIFTSNPVHWRDARNQVTGIFMRAASNTPSSVDIPTSAILLLPQPPMVRLHSRERNGNGLMNGTTSIREQWRLESSKSKLVSGKPSMIRGNMRSGQTPFVPLEPWPGRGEEERQPSLWGRLSTPQSWMQEDGRQSSL